MTGAALDGTIRHPADPHSILTEERRRPLVATASLNPHDRVEFGSFQLFGDGRLLHDGRPVALTPKERAVLRVLVDAGGRVVPKGELLDQAWPNEDVSESSLTRCMHTLRNQLGDGARAGECIETVPEFPGDVGRLGEILAARGWKTTVHDEDVRVSAPASQAADVNRAAAEAGITLSALRPHTASLEEVFLTYYKK